MSGIDAYWAAHRRGIEKTGGWLMIAAIGLLVAPTVALGVPAVPTLVAIGVLFLTGGVMVTHVPYVAPETELGIEDEARALTDEDARVPYQVPDRLWSEP